GGAGHRRTGGAQGRAELILGGAEGVAWAAAHAAQGGERLAILRPSLVGLADLDAGEEPRGDGAEAVLQVAIRKALAQLGEALAVEVGHLAARLLEAAAAPCEHYGHARRARAADVAEAIPAAVVGDDDPAAADAREIARDDEIGGTQRQLGEPGGTGD